MTKDIAITGKSLTGLSLFTEMILYSFLLSCARIMPEESDEITHDLLLSGVSEQVYMVYDTEIVR
jgi:hypothetical protein